MTQKLRPQVQVLHCVTLISYSDDLVLYVHGAISPVVISEYFSGLKKESSASLQIQIAHECFRYGRKKIQMELNHGMQQERIRLLQGNGYRFPSTVTQYESLHVNGEGLRLQLR